MAEIPFWFHDRPKWVSGIGKNTTCQDILQSLLKAHLLKTKDTTAIKEQDIKTTCQQLVLVEQWRGVERPLSNSSKILKLWMAWGEERPQVRFVVKRISTSSAEATALTTHSLTRGRKARRRNSKLASSSRSSVCDTVHPSAFKSSTDDIEKLMRLILTQGETIHDQLKRLQEREGQIETIEEEVHASRTKTAGKDYLLNAYLENVSDNENRQGNVKKAKKQPSDGSDVPDKTIPEMLAALTKVHKLNEELTTTEERLDDLESKVRSRSADPSDLDSTRAEVSRLKSINERVGKEIDFNKHLISTMQSAFDERRELMNRLEQDVGHIETEADRLRVELKRVTSHADLDYEDDEMIKDLMEAHERHYQLSSSQLYEDDPKLNIQSGLEFPGPPCTDSARINATGSPGSSTSGNSSSGCGTGSEKSVRFSDRDLIMATPDLPPIPSGDFPFLHSSSASSSPPGGVSQFTKSILKAVDPSGDLDSNSDTGLSSLHSSSDEGTYVLDTLV